MLRFVHGIAPSAPGRPALFVDRDGVLNRRIVDGYVLSPSELELLDGVVPALRQASELKVPIFVVSNQGCLSRRLLSEPDLVVIHRKLLDHLDGRGVPIEAIYVCPHHPAAVDPADRRCACRKPRPGLILGAAEDFGVDLAKSGFIGDQESDRQAALAAGIPTDRFWRFEAEAVTEQDCARLAAAVRAAFGVGAGH
jgi:D-glycero-D-manno-heptose 1,7-bisphosphate phosphatase